MTGTLYHSPAEIITQLVIDLGIADGPETDDGLTGWTVFPIQMEEDPDDAIQVTDTSGYMHGRSHVTGIVGEHYGIQILVRGSEDISAPYKKLKSIMSLFDEEVQRETVILLDDDNSVNRNYRVNAITRKSTVVPAGNDGRRYFWAANVVASIELASSDAIGTGS